MKDIIHASIGHVPRGLTASFFAQNHILGEICSGDRASMTLIVGLAPTGGIVCE